MDRHTRISRNDLMSLEQYAEKRAEFRQQVMDLKKSRKVALGPNMTLYFENRMTLIYQIQEMLRIEKIFDAPGINEELDTYNPLLPEGRNFKATMMIEYADTDVRASQLEKMVGIEDKLWMQIEGFDKTWSIANEDLERSNDSKTSAVHFMRFEISDEMTAALKDGANWTIGVNHPIYSYIHLVEKSTRESLLSDLR